MDISDFGETKDRIIALTKLTNTFKIILIEDVAIDIEERGKKVWDMFPTDINLKIMFIGIKGQGS